MLKDLRALLDTQPRLIRAVLLASFFVLLTWPLAMTAQSGTVVVRPREIQDVLLNPGMGIETFQRYNGDALNLGVTWSEEGPVAPISSPERQPVFPGSTVAYCRWFWDQLEPVQGNIRWDIIDRALAEARRHHQQLDIRLAIYDPQHPLPEWYRKSGAKRANTPESKDGAVWQPDFSDPLYSRHWGALVKEAGRRYDGHPELDAVDISTVGYWGEGWSDYMPPSAVQTDLIDIYLKAFRKTPLLMNFDEPGALKYGTSHGAGWRFDCLGNLEQPWSEMLDQYPQAIAETGIGEVWRTAPVSMETCWVPETWAKRGWDVGYILGEALRWHVSTINVKSTAIPPAWRVQFDDLQRRMGYRFALRRVEWNRQVRSGDALGLKSWWVNEGVAPVYRNYVLAFRLSSGQSQSILRTSVDVRKWLPGDAVFGDPMYVPADLPAGEYEVGVALLDPVTLQPAIQLGIEGRESDGWYRLGTTQVKQ